MKRSSNANSGLLYAVLWSVLTALLAFTILFLAGYGLTSIKGIDVETAELVAYIIYDLVIAISCYFICKRYPKSLLFVPAVSNIMGIISAIVEPNFWTSSLWILVICGWILSIVTSLMGSNSKKHML